MKAEDHECGLHSIIYEPFFTALIWDSIAAVPEAVPLSEDQKKELECRLEAYHLNPDAGSPWIEVRERLRGWSRS